MPRATFNVPDRSSTSGEHIKRPPRLTAAERRAPFSTRRKRLVAGCMTGTSIDGLDVALVSIDGDGMTMRAELVAETSRPFGDLAAPLRRLAEQQPMTAHDIADVARQLALLHLDALTELKRGRTIDLVCVHGQTVFHAPPLGWQLMNPSPIAHGLGIPLVFDLRAADLALGGQGAPLTPIADLILFGHGRERRTVVNLGGFCNLTRLPAGREPARVTGGDVCACNQVLDAVARTRLSVPYDRDGNAAWQGSEERRSTDALLRILRAQNKLGRSLGTGDEAGEWQEQLAACPPADIARSACAAIATVIVEAAQPTERLIVAGGGTHNRALMHEIKGRAGVPVDRSEDHGVPATLREAMAFAVLGALCQDRIPVTLSQVTGVDRAPISGCWVLP